MLLEAVCKNMKDRKVTGNSHHGFTEGESCLTNLVAFYHEIARSVDKLRAVDAIDFSKAFDVTSLSNAIVKMRDTDWKSKQLRWVQNWLDHHV